MSGEIPDNLIKKDEDCCAGKSHLSLPLLSSLKSDEAVIEKNIRVVC